MIRIHPGELLTTHYLQEANMTLQQLVTLCGVSQKKLVDFMACEIPVDDELANALSFAFNTGVQMWFEHQRRYDTGELRR